MGRPQIPFTKDILDLLGKVPDAQIARMAKCSQTAVVNRRQRLGIPGYVGTSAQAPAPAPAPVQAPTVNAASLPFPPALVTALRDALKQAKPTKDGMVLPFDAFARLAQGVLA